MNRTALLRFLITAAVVVAAFFAGRALWNRAQYEPWTRDGRVRADIVHIAPDVSGLVTEIGVQDNQLVRKGDVLFRIDRARFDLALAQARANLDAAVAQARAAGANVTSAQAAVAARNAEYRMRSEEADRRRRIGDVISQEIRSDAMATAASAQATLHQAQAATGQASAAQQQAEASVEQARVAVDKAQLDLDRTEVRAPVDGYVTNLEVRVGDYASAGAARMALVDSHSYYVYGYFEETKLPQLRVGDSVDVRLMAGEIVLNGRVESIARGIADRDNPTGSDLLANVNPTFNWVRLAQRVPVRIAIDPEKMPSGTVLSAGMTVTVIVKPSKRT